ncbi:MAG TPA: PAS domain S-box protein [Planctomycetota bacterium]|nr:PAS domain S-box protein [Planctomycetota bacterium]
MRSLTAVIESICARGPWARYAVAVGSAVLVTLLRLPAEPLFQGRAPYALYYLPVLLTAWYCGVAPTLVAIVASAVLSWILVVPHDGSLWQAEPGYGPSLLLFLLVCTGLIVMARGAAAMRRRADEAVVVARRAQAAVRAVPWEWDRPAAPPRLEDLPGLLGVEPEARLAYAEARRIADELQAALQRAGPFSVDFTVTHPTAGERQLRASGDVQRDGRLPHVSGMTFDVTERRVAEQARAWLAAIVDSSEDAIISKSLDGIVQSWNAGAERIFGFEPEEMIGQSITRIIPPERLDEEATILERLRRGERVEHFETVRLAKDGRRLHVSLTISPIRDASGRILGASKIARDISARRRAEEELAVQREWFRVTLESIGDGVIATDGGGRIVFMNSVAEALTGTPLDQARGRPCEEVFNVINEETREPVESPVARVLAKGVVVGLANHTLLIRADGGEVLIDDSGAPIRDQSGRIQGAVLVFRDVTARRGAEAERERLLDSERAARADAERANRLKDEFVATLSHELRTPLNAILGWTQLMVHPGIDSQQQRHGIEVIDRNARVQAQLVSDLLDVSGLMAGKLRLDVQRVDLPQVVHEAVETVRPAAAAKSIVIDEQSDGRLDDLSGDPVRLKQIAWNLLSNAVKFTPAGGHVRVGLRRVAGMAQLTVADSGPGIPPEFLPELFARFRQADSSASRRHGGLGLGLSIVRHLVELHGGSVRALDRPPGQGATFVVELPLPVPGSASRHEAPDIEAAAVDAGRGLQGVRVLVVEDQTDARELLVRLLREQQAQVLSSSSATEALRRLPDFDPHVLVSDIGLPDLDGLEFMRRVRQRDARRGSKLPAVAVTAFVRATDRARALEAGFDAHLGKPVDAAELLAVVTDLARRAREPQA